MISASFALVAKASDYHDRVSKGVSCNRLGCPLVV